MVRAPCCEKMGMKKGPWTPEEDQILIDYIQQYGHGNWRALPRHAKLLRCGKSCRLRWTNYLRPDIKRGNFSREEEETIIELHEMIGNRWSAIAARLPGRTDNEIKNVWHTHLKKKAVLRKNNNIRPKSSIIDQNNSIKAEVVVVESVNDFSNNNERSSESTCFTTYTPGSPQQSCSDISSSTVTNTSSYDYENNNNNTNMFKVDSPMDFPETDESFWSDVLSESTCFTTCTPGSPQQSCSDISSSTVTNTSSYEYENNYNNTNMFKVDSPMDFPETDESFWSAVLSPTAGNFEVGDFSSFEMDPQVQFETFSPLWAMEQQQQQQPVHTAACSSIMQDGSMDFWYNLFTRAEDSLDLQGI